MPRARDTHFKGGGELAAGFFPSGGERGEKRVALFEHERPHSYDKYVGFKNQIYIVTLFTNYACMQTMHALVCDTPVFYNPQICWFLKQILT